MNDTAATIVLAECEMKEGNYERALHLFQSVINDESNNSRMWLSMAICKLYNLSAKPYELYTHSKSIIEVTFQFLTKAMYCFDDNQNIENLKTWGINVSSVISQVDRDIQSKATNELINANNNKRLAEENKKWSIFNGFMTWGSNDLFNKLRFANNASQNWSNVNSFEQEFQNSQERINCLNNIKSYIRAEKSKLDSNLGALILQRTNELQQLVENNIDNTPPNAPSTTQALHLVEKFENKREDRPIADNNANSEYFLKEKTVLLSYMWRLRNELHNYYEYEKMAKIHFKNKSYREAAEMALAANRIYELILTVADNHHKFKLDHRNTELINIITYSRNMIKKDTD